MKPKQLALLVLAALLLTVPFSLAAAETDQADPAAAFRYDTGDQLFFFDAGLYRPLFVLSSAEGFDPVLDNTYFGGNAGMGFEAFLNHNVSLGAEISYTFAYAKDNNLYTSVPLSASLSYYLSQGTIDLPISLGAGVVYNSFADQSYLSPIFLKPQVGLFWNFNENWGVGIDLDYWFVPEFYTGTNADKTAYLNSASVRLALQYMQ